MDPLPDEIPDEVPDVRVLERRHTRYQRFQTGVFVVIALLDAALLVHLSVGSGSSLGAGLRFGWPLIGVCVWLWISLGHLLTDAVPLHRAEAEHLGGYTRDQVSSMVRDLLTPFKGREQPNIYLRRCHEPGAECIERWGLNFLRPMNAIYVHSMLLHLLRPEEMRAILAHELGHFYRYTHALRRGDLFVLFFMGLVVAEIGWLMEATSFSSSLLWGGAVFLVLFLVFGAALNHLARDQEYLSDLFAARLAGKLNIINALMQLGKGLEVSERIYEKTLQRMRDDEELPYSALGTVVGIIDRTLPERLLQPGEEDETLDEVFSGEEVAALRQPIEEKDREARLGHFDKQLKRYEKKPGYEVLDWDLFDNRVRNLRVDEVEYPALLQALLASPGQQMLNFTYDHSGTEDGVHPTLRQRILFLEKNC